MRYASATKRTGRLERESYSVFCRLHLQVIPVITTERARGNMSKMGQYVLERQELFNEAYAARIDWDEFRSRCNALAEKQGLPITHTCSMEDRWKILTEMKKEKALNERK